MPCRKVSESSSCETNLLRNGVVGGAGQKIVGRKQPDSPQTDMIESAVRTFHRYVNGASEQSPRVSAGKEELRVSLGKKKKNSRTKEPPY